MELAQLEAFDRVARTGSFSRAAEVIGLTQPSVSARIAGLEVELGGKLFERGGRRLRLTPLGEAFLPYTERALAVLADGRRAAQRVQSGRSGGLVIAALNTEFWMLDSVLVRFRKTYPQVDLRVTPRNHPDIPNTLYDGVAGLGLTGTPLYDRGISVLARFQVPVGALVSADHALAQQQATQGRLYIEDLYPHTIIRANLGPQVTSFVEGVIEEARRQRGGGTMSLPSLIAGDSVLQGQGVAFLTVESMRPHLEARRMVQLDLVDMPRLYQEPLLIRVHGRDLDEPAAAFVQMLKAQWRKILIG
jgi:DNA-binding transcriptional LysR family regulator